MALQGYILNSGVVHMPCVPWKPRTYNASATSSVIPRSRSPAKVLVPRVKSSWAPHHNLKSCPKEIQSPSLSSSSSSILSASLGSLSYTTSNPTKRRQSLQPLQAAKHTAMTEKPKWWWRSLACLPYLLPLHAWNYAETTYHIHPLLEDFEFLTYPFRESLGRWPLWVLTIYPYVAYFGVAKKKEWPHFLRFHVMMAMLLEIGLQIIGTLSRWMPFSIYLGKFGMHFWTAVAVANLLTVLECLRCAVSGKYTEIPMISDAAYVQTKTTF